MITFGLVVVVSFLVCSSTAYDQMFHRHRHSKGQSLAYDLDRLMNRLDSHTSTQKPRVDLASTDANLDPVNSLWDDDFTIGGTSTMSPLDTDQRDKIISENEKQREHQEDAEDELEEQSEEEDGFLDQKEQADSFNLWGSKSGESAYTKTKWDSLGSKKSVDNLFNMYRRTGSLKPDSPKDMHEFLLSSKQIARETQCRVPRPKVIKVSDFYPHPSKTYLPSCIVLHQCGEDTGCCGSTQTCGPKTYKRIELLVYTYAVSPHSHQRVISGLEKLAMYNHTECDCRDRQEEVMPRDGQNAEYRSERNADLGCKCPSEYTVRRLANGSCSCDCFDKQRDCIKYKKGKEYFNHSDKLCIEMGSCQQPACDFGVYIRSSGRCPRKHEKFRTWSRFH